MSGKCAAYAILMILECIPSVYRQYETANDVYFAA